jgi:hypothetical protein
LVLGKGQYTKEMKTAIQEIRSLRVGVSYPFLLQLLNDFDADILQESHLLEILNLVASYVFRRSICGIPTNSMNKTFATLGSEITCNSYLESIKNAFSEMDSYRRFPSNQEFIEAFKSRDIYSLRNRNYLLIKLENYRRKEQVDVESYTIEHILPQNQNLSQNWTDMLGENWKDIQGRYLHTIGNLTLTGYNSELSDRPFREKRDMEGGFKDSPIRLNRYLSDLEKWTEEDIVARSQELATMASEIWTELEPHIPH